MVKNIAIMDQVYAALVSQKREGESFSKEILRIMERKGSIMDFAGAWKISEAEAQEMKDAIAKAKRSATRHVLEKVQG